MPINHQLKIIFVHIPKTAGTSFEYALGMHGELEKVGIIPYINQRRNKENLFGDGLQHLDARVIRRKTGRKRYDSYYKFSIVRNPYDRLVSHFAWLQGKWHQQIELKPQLFHKFINENSKRKGETLLPLSQCQYIIKKGDVLVNDIFYFEHLEEGFAKLNKQFHLNKSLEHRMQSYHSIYQNYYTTEIQEFVYQYYKNDFLTFGYDKEL